MSGSNGNGKPTEYFAKLTMEAIEHQMGLGNRMNQVLYAILRCSICYPHQSPTAVRPEIDGSFEKFVVQIHERIKKQRLVCEQDIKEERTGRDHRGAPIPLSWKDLTVLTGLRESHVGKALARLRDEGVIADEFPLRPIPKPTYVFPFCSLSPGESQNFDKSFRINKKLKNLSHFIGVTLSSRGSEDEFLAESAAELVDELYAVRLDAEKEAREKVRRIVAERGAESGIFIERTVRNSRTVRTPPTPSSPPAPQEERAEKPPSQSSAENAEAPTPQDPWQDFLLLVAEAQMDFTGAELPWCEKKFKSYSRDKQQAAYRGIRERLDSGEYDPVNDPDNIPALNNYLFGERWERRQRQRKKSQPDTSWIEAYGRGEVDLAEN